MVFARLITYRLGKGREEYRLLCSILDPRKVPAIQLATSTPAVGRSKPPLAEPKTRLRGARDRIVTPRVLFKRKMNDYLNNPCSSNSLGEDL